MAAILPQDALIDESMLDMTGMQNRLSMIAFAVQNKQKFAQCVRAHREEKLSYLSSLYRFSYVEQRQHSRSRLVCLIYAFNCGLQVKTGKHGLNCYHGNVSYETKPEVNT